jgi:hypothetical protein
MMRGRASTPLNMAAVTAIALLKHGDAAAVIRPQSAAFVADCETVVSVAAVAAAAAVSAVAAFAAAVAVVAALSGGVNYQTAG